MKLTHYPCKDLNWSGWKWKLLFGPASIVDGLVETFTLGSFSLSLRLTVSRNLARARIEAMRAKQ